MIFDQGPPEPPPPRFNIAAHVLGGAPGQTALEVVDAAGRVTERWSYHGLAAAIRATAGALLAAGVRQGEVVALRLPNASAFPLAFFGCAWAGILPMPLSPQLTEPEMARLLDLAETGWVLSDRDEGPHPLPARRLIGAGPEAPMADTAPDDPAYIVSTSGTGGRPKAVLHAHRAAWARRMMWRDWYGLAPADRMLHAGAFNWTYTLGTGLTDPWAIGATAIVAVGAGRHDWAPIAQATGATLFAAAPGIFRQTLESPLDGFRGLRAGLAAGEALVPAVRGPWEAGVGAPIRTALGMTECSTYVSQRPEGGGPKPQRGRRVAILDDAGGAGGELAIATSDPGLMLRYLGEAPPAGDWFRTGDRAAMAEDFTIRHLGRADDILNAGGIRVSAQEIEAVLAEAPDIGEACVVELPVRAGVTILAAFHTGRATAEALAAHCSARLARYKQPRRYTRVAALPRTATGKLRRRALIDQHGWRP